MLHIDFETRSKAELGGPSSVGLHNYVTDPSTDILMLAWAIDDGDVSLWEPRSGEVPYELTDALLDPDMPIAAWNSSFERYVLKHKLFVNLPIKRFQDPQASARYLSLPADLGTCGNVLGLPHELMKDKRGDELLNIFSYPTQRKKKRGEAPTYFFRDWTTDPEDWKALGEYCKQDVRAEREIMRRLKLLNVFPLPERERKIWIFDQVVNDRGIPVDVQFVKKAYALASREKGEAIEKQNQLTGLENANSPVQMLAWVREQGYIANSLRKEAVAAELKYSEKLTPLGRQVLEARKAASSTTYKKLSAILRQVSKDNRLRNQFIYMGSSRCGRWSGNAVQLHNMARPEERFEDSENMDWLRAMIHAEDYDAIKLWFPIEKEGKKEPGSVLLCVKSAIRTAFVCNPSKRFNVCDLNAIETRVSAWVSGCAALLKVFETYFCLDHPEFVRPTKGKCGCGKKLLPMDPYLDFAVKMTGIPYINLARDIKSKDPAIKSAAKRHRQVAKPGVLGCCYRLGGGQMGTDFRTGDPVKQGLWGYAENMQVEMTREQAHEIVKVYRESYKEICQMWYALEKAVADVLDPETTMVKREVGPNGCIKIDKINITGRDPILRIQLPSGRYLHYIDASLQEVKMPWEDREGNEVYRSTLVYSGIDQITKQWRSVTSHGGKIFENIVQGIARDVLAEYLLKFEFELDLPIVLHVHDEGGSETENDLFAPGLEAMEHTMSQPIDWAPGLPLAADGFEGGYYHK